MIKINKKNLIKLIMLLIAVVIPLSDFITIIIETLNGFTIGLTYFGIVVDILCLYSAQIIIDDLFEN